MLHDAAPSTATSAAASASAQPSLTRYLTPLNAWALSLGGAIGWGAFVMPATTLLPTAGPVGTIIALLIGALIMVVVAANFHVLANRYPDSGGAYAFTKRIFGHDHAFLCFWAIVLAYVAIMWANATAFVLIIRYLFGPVFQVGFHYQVAGFDVYMGEVIFTIVVLAAAGGFTCMRKRIVNLTNTVLALVLIIGSIVCFAVVLAAHPEGVAKLDPPFAPDSAIGVQIFGIVALAPWAYLGFESVSNAAGEFAFSAKRMFPVMAAGVLSAALIYIMMTMVSAIGTPVEYASWADYIADLGNHEGLSGLPTFHAMQMALGPAGVSFLAVVVLAAMTTSLIGLYRAAGRLIYAVAQDNALPPWFGQLNSDGVPRNAIVFIMLVSFVVPFVGRAAIGWIVDVTSVSAAIVYGYVSACSFRVAWDEKRRSLMVSSAVGVAFAAVFLVYPLVPNLWSVSALAPASYLILAAWGIVGLMLFRFVFNRDEAGRFGKSTVMWVFMLFLVFFSTTMWTRQNTSDTMDLLVNDVSTYYVEEYKANGDEIDEESLAKEEAFLQRRTDEARDVLLFNSLVQMFLIIIALGLMLNIYTLIRRREKILESQRIAAQESSRAKTIFLSNMSHDIRTPMNAIIGYTHLARREGTTLEEAQKYLTKIDGSSKHLLALINDVLEMSRIESGKMELEPVESNLAAMMDGVRDMFVTQMHEKGLVFTVDAKSVKDRFVMCDANYLNRVLLNLLSNAYKFTPEGGYVTVQLTQVGDAVDERATYELRVKDTGIGMTEEFAAKVFEAFERERNATVSGIQGTGLGMAITKRIVEAMDGTIRVVTAPGEGTEFVLLLEFPVVDKDVESADADAGGADDVIDFSGMRLLLVEDNEINREIASLVLEEVGFSVDIAENGKIALDKVSESTPGDYQVVLMDVQMPVMNGYEATQAIRALDNDELAHIPIVAASANAFAEDVQAARDAGMDAHVAKPLDVDKLVRVLAELLDRSGE